MEEKQREFKELMATKLEKQSEKIREQLEAEKKIEIEKL